MEYLPSTLSLWPQVDKILKVIPRQRVTYLYSATMTKKVQKLQRASLHDPVKVEVSTKYAGQLEVKVHMVVFVVDCNFFSVSEGIKRLKSFNKATFLYLASIK